MEKSEWVSAADAARILSVDHRAVTRLAHRGLIKTRFLPSVQNRYLRASVQALAEISIGPVETDLQLGGMSETVSCSS